MLSVVKTVVLSAVNAEEIAIASKHISLLMHFIAGIYICPPRWREVIAGIYMPSAPRELIIELINSTSNDTYSPPT